MFLQKHSNSIVIIVFGNMICNTFCFFTSICHDNSDSQHHPLHAGPLRGRQVTGRHRHPDGQRLCGQPDHAAAVRPPGQQRHSGPVPLLPAGAAGAHGLHARAAGAQDPPQLIFCHSPFRIQQKAPCPVSRAGSLLFSGQLQDAAADGIGHGKQVVLSNEAELCLVLIRKAYGQL